jgi:hypothetical protein
VVAGLGRLRDGRERRRRARRSAAAPAPAAVAPVTQPGFVPEQLLEIDLRLDEVAVAERARLSTRSRSVVDELRAHPRDVLGGFVDLERGNARVRFADRDVVLVTEDIEELRTVVESATVLPTALNTARSSGTGPSVLVFSVQDWTVVIAADPVLSVDR